MSKSLDQLARNLASGMSRRKALWQFVSGLGVVAALTGGRKAYANSPLCGAFCAAQAEIFYALCLEASLRCSRGSCAEFSLIAFNGGVGITDVAVNRTGNVNFNGGPFICVPVGRR